MTATILSVGRADSEVLINGCATFTGTLDELVRELETLRAKATPVHVVTPNVDQILNLGSSPAFASAFAAADLRLLDGMPLVLLARSLGAKSVHRNTGADLLPATALAAPERSWRIVITGGTTETALEAARRLNEQIGAESVEAVPFPMITHPADPRGRAVVDELWKKGPDLVFLCLGSPKQELWFESWKALLPPAVYIGAGAAVDFAAGTTRRAPRALQKASLEWLWRLAQEPARLARRYLVQGPHFIRVVVRSHMRKLK